MWIHMTSSSPRVWVGPGFHHRARPAYLPSVAKNAHDSPRGGMRTSNGGLVSWTGWVGASRVWFGSPPFRTPSSLRLATSTPGMEDELTARTNMEPEKTKGLEGRGEMAEQMMRRRALGNERRI